MSYDAESERAALIVRASDSGMTPGEQAATEEADRRQAIADTMRRKGWKADAENMAASAQEWRDLAVKARYEDLKNRQARQHKREKRLSKMGS